MPNSETFHKLSQIHEEVSLLSKLQHPHVIRLLGSVQEDSHLNIFIEWMAGGSVASLLDRFGAFAEITMVNYTCQVLLGLDYLHTCGILHRDLKGQLIEMTILGFCHEKH